MASPSTLKLREHERAADLWARGVPIAVRRNGFLNRHERRKAEKIARTGHAHRPEQHERPQPVAAPINAEQAAPEVPPA